MSESDFSRVRESLFSPADNIQDPKGLMDVVEGNTKDFLMGQSSGPKSFDHAVRDICPRNFILQPT